MRAPLDFGHMAAMWPRAMALAPFSRPAPGHLAYVVWPVANITTPAHLLKSPGSYGSPPVRGHRTTGSNVMLTTPARQTIAQSHGMVMYVFAPRAGAKPRPFSRRFKPLFNSNNFIYRRFIYKLPPAAQVASPTCESFPCPGGRGFDPRRNQNKFYNINQQPIMQRHVAAHDWATWRFKNQLKHATCQPVIGPRHTVVLPPVI
jgi:hypothetical protein